MTSTSSTGAINHQDLRGLHKSRRDWAMSMHRICCAFEFGTSTDRCLSCRAGLLETIRTKKLKVDVVTYNVCIVALGKVRALVCTFDVHSTSIRYPFDVQPVGLAAPHTVAPNIASTPPVACHANLSVPGMCFAGVLFLELLTAAVVRGATSV